MQLQKVALLAFIAKFGATYCSRQSLNLKNAALF
jgi:hypothetical protein